jgi:hypothetical protein
VSTLSPYQICDGSSDDVTACDCNIGSTLWFVNITDDDTDDDNHGGRKCINLIDRHSDPIQTGQVQKEWQFFQKFSLNVDAPPTPPVFIATLGVVGNFFSEAATLNPGSPTPNPLNTSLPIFDYCEFNAAYNATQCNIVWPPA